MLFVLAAEYGSVICDGVEMADIPFELQEARVFKLHLRGNGLHRFPDAKLQGTGKRKKAKKPRLVIDHQGLGEERQHGLGVASHKINWSKEFICAKKEGP